MSYFGSSGDKLYTGLSGDGCSDLIGQRTFEQVDKTFHTYASNSHSLSMSISHKITDEGEYN